MTLSILTCLVVPLSMAVVRPQHGLTRRIFFEAIRGAEQEPERGTFVSSARR